MTPVMRILSHFTVFLNTVVHHFQPPHAIRESDAWGWLICDIRTTAFKACPAFQWGRMWHQIPPVWSC